jgi:NADPH:quinone reductase-like Zn-dependent oxidoreductase
MAIAMTYERFGGPDVLTLAEVKVPVPQRGQVLVKVRAAGVNPLDVKIRRGDLAGQFPVRFPITPGLDVAGVVAALGADVSGLAVGDAVFGVTPAGSYAQYALATQLQRKPDTIDWDLAAALPTVGEAAFRALGHLDMQAGETLLIHGAGGSVGTIATQIAISRGIAVIASVGEGDLERVAALGAIALDYTRGLTGQIHALPGTGITIDAVLDAAGAGLLPESVALAGGPQRVVTLADPAAVQYKVRFSGGDPTDRDPTALAQLAQLAAAGDLRLPIWRTYPLAEAALAHTDIEGRRNHGKIILHP